MIKEVNYPINLMLKNKLSKKRFSLQFLPESLVSISKVKKISFNDKNLKTSYLIDIVHNMLLKYYFKRNNNFTLNSLILKEKYGHQYNHYIDFLVNKGIIKLISNYMKGKKSRSYSLNENIINSKILRWKNYDKFLLKKYINRYLQSEADINEIIPTNIKSKLISDLYSVDIEYDRCLYYLDNLSDIESGMYNRNIYSIESIKDSHIFYHFDSYGRMHSNFTILKSFMRKNCLLIDGEETCEIDIPNSQPLFLAKLIKDSESKWVKKDELDLFYILVRNGNYYQYLIDNLKLKDKRLAKELTYKVLFGKNHLTSKWDKMFQKLFPSIHQFIKLYKKEHGDYKILAHHLQKMESNLIFKEIINTIMIVNPDIKIITIHDSIVIPNKWRDLVEEIFIYKLTEL